MKKVLIFILILTIFSSFIFGGCNLDCDHDWGEGEEKVSPTCTTDGEKIYVCTKCNQTKTEKINKIGHDYSAGYEVDENKHWARCTICGKNSQKQNHEYQDGMCVCGKLEEATYIREGNTVYFGKYPQTEIVDFYRTTTLLDMAGDYPTSANSGNWTSYNYYLDGEERNYMWYIDLDLDGEKYRGVYFSNYRSYLTSYPSNAESSYQDDHTYYSHIVFWFKYEPIKWTVIREDGPTAILLCDTIIDSQEFYSRYNNTRLIKEQKVYPNNYEHSSIREWLNNVFFETAFSAGERAIVYSSYVDNSINSTLSATNKYLCNDTRDRVYLLSHNDILSGEYALNPEICQKKVTDYSKCQGCWASQGEDTLGNGYWWLRTPDSKNSFFAGRIDADGLSGSYDYVDATRCGVVPVVKIQL